MQPRSAAQHSVARHTPSVQRMYFCFIGAALAFHGGETASFMEACKLLNVRTRHCRGEAKRLRDKEEGVEGWGSHFGKGLTSSFVLRVQLLKGC